MFAFTGATRPGSWPTLVFEEVTVGWLPSLALVALLVALVMSVPLVLLVRLASDLAMEINNIQILLC